jgi:hypothetical protein
MQLLCRSQEKHVSESDEVSNYDLMKTFPRQPFRTIEKVVEKEKKGWPDQSFWNPWSIKSA